MLPLEPTPYSKDYEITDAMFGAFRSPGGAPFFWKLFGWGTLLMSVVGILSVGYLLSAYVDVIRANAMIGSNPEQASESVGAAGRFFFAMILFVVGYAAIMAIIRAAFFRGYFFGDYGGTMPFRFGSDEVRLWLSYLGYTAVLTIAVTILSIVLIIPILILVFTIGPNSMAITIIGIILVYAFLAVAYIYLGVRLSAASALTALNRRTHVLAARKVTKNRFWALFGSLLVAGLIGYVVSYTASSYGILMAFPSLEMSDLITIMTGLDPDAAVNALETASGTSRFAITSIVAIILTSAGYVFYSLMLAGPQAFFTQQWADSGAAHYDASNNG